MNLSVHLSDCKGADSRRARDKGKTGSARAPPGAIHQSHDLKCSFVRHRGFEQWCDTLCNIRTASQMLAHVASLAATPVLCAACRKECMSLNDLALLINNAAAKTSQRHHHLCHTTGNGYVTDINADWDSDEVRSRVRRGYIWQHRRLCVSQQTWPAPCVAPAF